eukprot:s4658_g8.t1
MAAELCSRRWMAMACLVALWHGLHAEVCERLGLGEFERVSSWDRCPQPHYMVEPKEVINRSITSGDGADSSYVTFNFAGINYELKDGLNGTSCQAPRPTWIGTTMMFQGVCPTDGAELGVDGSPLQNFQSASGLSKQDCGLASLCLHCAFGAGIIA